VSTAILFYLYAAIAIAGAIVLVTMRNLVHAAMGLFATMIAIAGLYLLIGSEFLAAMQLFVYGGAITVLVLFGLMLAGPVLGHEELPRRGVVWVAGIVSLLFFGAIAAVLWQTDWQLSEPTIHDTASIATILFSRYVLPFEIAGLSLTIALIGSVVIAREDDIVDTPAEQTAPTSAVGSEEGGAA